MISFLVRDSSPRLLQIIGRQLTIFEPAVSAAAFLVRQARDHGVDDERQQHAAEAEDETTERAGAGL
jgi:hypothetical protein